MSADADDHAAARIVRTLLLDLSRGYTEADLPDRAEEAADAFDEIVARLDAEKAEIERLRLAIYDAGQA